MKLFITDYDGTLYTSDDSIKENNKKLKELQENHFYVVISTGRSYPSIKTQINLYHIPYDFICCADGSIIYDNKGNILNMSILDKEIVNHFIEFYQKLDYEEIQFSYPDGYYSNLQNNDNLLGINICLATNKFTKEIDNSFQKIKDEYPKYNYLSYAHPNFSYLCIKPENISKSSAVSFLQEKYHISKDDIYVIGDSSNDLEMIRDYHGVCMENSSQEVLNITKKVYKEVSDYIEDILS